MIERDRLARLRRASLRAQLKLTLYQLRITSLTMLSKSLAQGGLAARPKSMRTYTHSMLKFHSGLDLAVTKGGNSPMTRFGLAFLAVLTALSSAQAGDDPGAPLSSAQSVGHGQRQTLPDDFKLSMMIRSTVIAVNQANKTNNYTVLRDLGSPRFKEANSAKKLAEIFKALRDTKFDLAPVLFFTPQMQVAPAINDEGMLRLTGFFDTVPQRMSFDLLFEEFEGEWMIYGLNIATHPSPAVRDRGAPPPKKPGSTATK